MKIVGHTDKRGTRQQFWPDASIFTTTTFKWDIVANRMRELAFLNAGITIKLIDERPDRDRRRANRPSTPRTDSRSSCATSTVTASISSTT